MYKRSTVLHTGLETKAIYSAHPACILMGDTICICKTPSKELRARGEEKIFISFIIHALMHEHILINYRLWVMPCARCWYPEMSDRGTVSTTRAGQETALD